MFVGCRFTMTANGLGLGEEGDYEAQMLNKPQMFLEAQMLNLALLPLFRQTLVSCRCFFTYYFSNTFKLSTLVFIPLSCFKFSSLPLKLSILSIRSFIAGVVIIGFRSSINSLYFCWHK